MGVGLFDTDVSAAKGCLPMSKASSEIVECAAGYTPPGATALLIVRRKALLRCLLYAKETTNIDQEPHI